MSTTTFAELGMQDCTTFHAILSYGYTLEYARDESTHTRTIVLPLSCCLALIISTAVSVRVFIAEPILVYFRKM